MIYADKLLIKLHVQVTDPILPRVPVDTNILVKAIVSF